MKKRVPKGWVKISDFEQLVGVSTKTVMSAIKRGYIPSEIADVVGTSATAPYYLDPKKAAVSWYHSLNSGHPNQRKVRTALGAYIRTFDAAVVEPAAPEAEETAAPPNMSYEEAQLREKVAKAKFAELELQEKEGALVERVLVEAQLFAAGKELRDALLAIPDRIADIVMAAGDRTTVYNTIYDAIAAELQKLADIQLSGQ